MCDKEPTIPMYFSSLEIENVKCFGQKQILDLKNTDGTISPWTLILGDNGVGKTTLLKCLAWMIPVEATTEDEIKDEKLIVNDIVGIAIDREIKDELNSIKKDTERSDEPQKVKIKPFMDGFEKDAEYEQLMRLGHNRKYRIGATLTNGVEFGSIPAQDGLISHAINVRMKEVELDNDTLELDVETLEFGELMDFNSPTLYAYSASRHMNSKNFDNSELKSPISNLFSDSSDLYDAEEVLSNLDSTAMYEKIESEKNGIKEEGSTAKLLLKVKKILVALLPDIENTDCIIVNPRLKKDGTKNEKLVEVQTSDGKVPLFDISLGYKTMLAWIVDLAYRMFLHNSEKDNPLEEPAVVIVDEIDLHLHPKWQRIVRQQLMEHFPKTQFICTAHSPFMAQASESENLCVIKRTNGEVKIENAPYIVKGWRIGQVATSDLFDNINGLGLEEEGLVNERRAILDKRNRTLEDELRLKKLDDELSKLPVVENKEDQKLLDQIRKAAELLKEKGIIK